MQDFGDRMTVYFRPRRFWGQLVFLVAWLLGWTAGGAFALFAFIGAAAGERLFLLVWLCMWVVGECSAAGEIAWQVFGRELLIVTSTELEVRKEIRRFARTKQYDAALVREIRAALVPSDEDEKPRKDFCLRMKYRDRDVRIGEGMGEREAEHVASIVLERIRPRRWCGEEDRGAADVDTLDTEPERMRRIGGARAAAIALPIVALAAVLVLLIPRKHHAPPRTVHRAAPPAHSPWPMPEDFGSAREYAAAVTSYVLRSGRSKLLGRPTCGAHVTRTKWTCRATVKRGWGSLGARAVPYRCSAVATGGVTCGLATRGPAVSEGDR